VKSQHISLPHAQIIDLPAFSDERGWFVKTFNDVLFRELGIGFELKESYFSVSAKDVVRGMHFQTPPHQHAKIVFCPFGAVLDVIVDLRRGSPTYGQHFAQELSAENHKAYYIPEGFAHGFRSLTEGAITYYLVSSGYSQPNDSGILYSSIGFDWQLDNPIISARDLSFSPLEAFDSPFVFTSAVKP
jgi:dTDP-4-dehydrorhamnose 3,5-epimerase